MHRADRAANWCATVRTKVFKTVYAISKPNKLAKSNKKRFTETDFGFLRANHC